MASLLMQYGWVELPPFMSLTRIGKVQSEHKSNEINNMKWNKLLEGHNNKILFLSFSMLVSA